MRKFKYSPAPRWGTCVPNLGPTYAEPWHSRSQRSKHRWSSNFLRAPTIVYGERWDSFSRRGRSAQKNAWFECFNDWGRRGYDGSVPGKVTKTTPSQDRTTWSTTWLASLPRTKLISPGSWPNKCPGEAIFAPSLPKTWTNLLHPHLPPNRWTAHSGFRCETDQPVIHVLNSRPLKPQET